MKAVRAAICFAVTKYSILIEVHDPLMKHLIIELVKSQLLIVLMVVNQVYFLAIHRYTAESQIFTILVEPVYCFLIELTAGWRDFLPFELSPNFVLITQLVNSQFEAFSIIGF